MPVSKSSSALAAVACGALCAVFAAVAWAAVSGKSATMDEPSHAAVGWLDLYRRDFRMSPDVPPWWEEWVALPMGPGALRFDAESPAYREVRTRAT